MNIYSYYETSTPARTIDVFHLKGRDQTEGSPFPSVGRPGCSSPTRPLSPGIWAPLLSYWINKSVLRWVDTQAGQSPTKVTPTVAVVKL